MALGPELVPETLSVVGLHVGTYHDNGPYENFNPGVYWVHNNWTAGTYYNSVRTTSVYAGYTWNWKTPTLPVVDAVTLTAAIATGYPNTIDGTDLSLLVLPSARINLSPTVGMRFTLLPYVRKYNPATSIHFSVEQSF